MYLPSHMRMDSTPPPSKRGLHAPNAPHKLFVGQPLLTLLIADIIIQNVVTNIIWLPMPQCFQLHNNVIITIMTAVL